MPKLSQYMVVWTCAGAHSNKCYHVFKVGGAENAENLSAKEASA